MVFYLFSFANSSILSSYIDVLRTYPSNTPYLNHCIIRMFHRVSVDCHFPGILFQMSLFRILQKFHLDPLAKSSQFSVGLIFKSINFIEKIFYSLGIITIWYLVNTSIFCWNTKESLYIC